MTEPWMLLSLAVGVLCAVIWLYVSQVLPHLSRRRLAESTRALSTAVELRYPALAGITDDLVACSRLLGQSVGLRRRELARLELAATLRDVGLCAIPYRLLNGRIPETWDPHERHVFERHPDVGASMLELVPSLAPIARIVRFHHAPFDGSAGKHYPEREEIPIESRILHLVFDYLCAERRQGALIARTLLRDGSGTQYDPRLVETFLSVITSDGDFNASGSAAQNAVPAAVGAGDIPARPRP